MDCPTARTHVHQFNQRVDVIGETPVLPERTNNITTASVEFSSRTGDGQLHIQDVHNGVDGERVLL